MRSGPWLQHHEPPHRGPAAVGRGVVARGAAGWLGHRSRPLPRSVTAPVPPPRGSPPLRPPPPRQVNPDASLSGPGAAGSAALAPRDSSFPAAFAGRPRSPAAWTRDAPPASRRGCSSAAPGRTSGRSLPRHRSDHTRLPGRPPRQPTLQPPPGWTNNVRRVRLTWEPRSANTAATKRSGAQPPGLYPLRVPVPLPRSTQGWHHLRRARRVTSGIPLPDRGDPDECGRGGIRFRER